ncbi:DEAD/DEAH box helicase [Bacillus suaedae]|uniref:AAA family ATPase n=1 Tax=Halalkalibacter suaedae TaxID=2822140 RepID=A0A940WRY7_9BACI|nr:AAA domain-containing protein [Bacillus suaedae]MBP3951604.1 AAA family ATPase [Bacillus suaedae]
MKKQLNPYRCPVTLTNKAKDKMRELKLDEPSFFSLEKSFHVYIEKYPPAADRTLSAALFFDNETNVRMAEKYSEFVVVLHCVMERDRLIATNVTTRASHTPVQTNWRRSATISFDLNRHSGETISLSLLNLLHEMPVAQESSQYVKKRIASWEGYLKIQERSADIPDMTSRYSGLMFNRDFTRVTIKDCEFNEKEWKSLKDLSVKLKGIDRDIGKVLKANRSARTVEVELNGNMEERARKQELDVNPKEVIFSNFATLSQVKRLRQGFRHLENGLAVNPELERLLFENKPPVQIAKKQVVLKFHNRLNEFQQEAVTGAMSAEDLYVIQGPPGTGKTTVISEICLQNAKAGLRTLVASQSNLAVDNALGRLLANQDIRILRVGRTESIEEEGKKFIEENVGQYWKDHTLKEVSAQFAAGQKREAQLEVDWTMNEREYEQQQAVLERVEAELKTKQNAEKKDNELKSKIAEKTDNVAKGKQQQQALMQELEQLTEALSLLNDSIENDKEFLQEQPDSQEIQSEWEANEKIILRLQNIIASQELEETIKDKERSVKYVANECEKWAEETKKSDALVEKITAVKQIDGLRWIMLEQNIKRTLPIQQLLDELEDIRGELNQLKKLHDYHDKLSKAISYLEQLLEKHRIPFSPVGQKVPNGAAAYTAAEIDRFLEELRSKLKGSMIYPQMLTVSREGLYLRRKFIEQRQERFKSFDIYKEQAKEAFQLLKQELLEEFQPNQRDNRLLYQKWLRTLEEENTELNALQHQLKEMIGPGEKIPNASEMLPIKKATAVELKNKIDQLEKVKKRLEENTHTQVNSTNRIKEAEADLADLKSFLKKLKNEINEMAEDQATLTSILATEPEREHEEVLKKIASLSFTRESLKEERKRLPLFQSIQGKWLSLLEEASDHDLDEIRKLYVKHANVIGTTCVASARKDFIDSYPEFDVVIIDEVSKATPPELLLPMLKGKKIILVGDHHQLPPLLGNDTLEETLQEMADGSDDFDGKAELNNLLKESLFERLFKNLPKSNKTMLAIQYRMHENIMETITPFYEQENEHLQCGLTDSDSQRDHLLESEHIQRENHLLWLDMPNEPTFFEERMKGGKSLFNPAELKRIGELLQELDSATALAKQAGRMKSDELKSVGVISFYGEQVKRIDRLIQQELKLKHLTIRTGTVDRFQGMEMDVILLSMVRNHDNKQDDIGFAKDYRRLNVALSRARELLVLIGSTTMFTEKTKQREARKMYTHVLDATKKQNGLRMLEEVVPHG